VRDNGGVAIGGIDTSDAQTFTITVNPVKQVNISDPWYYCRLDDFQTLSRRYRLCRSRCRVARRS